MDHSAGIGAEEMIFERRNRRVRRIEKVLRVEQIVTAEIMDVSVKRGVSGRQRIVVEIRIAEFGGKVGGLGDRCRYRRTRKYAARCGEPLLAGTFANSGHIHSATQSEKPVRLRQTFARRSVIARFACSPYFLEVQLDGFNLFGIAGQERDIGLVNIFACVRRKCRGRRADRAVSVMLDFQAENAGRFDPKSAAAVGDGFGVFAAFGLNSNGGIGDGLAARIGDAAHKDRADG